MPATPYRVDVDLTARRNATAAAQDWADAVTDLLLTVSPDPVDVVAFARTRGAVAGRWVSDVDGLTIRSEGGEAVRFDGRRFVLACRANAPMG